MSIDNNSCVKNDIISLNESINFYESKAIKNVLIDCMDEHGFTTTKIDSFCIIELINLIITNKYKDDYDWLNFIQDCKKKFIEKYGTNIEIQSYFDTLPSYLQEYIDILWKVAQTIYMIGNTFPNR